MDGIDPKLTFQALTAFKKIYVGFSGGLDSSVLLHQLSRHPTLVDKLVVVHVHHGLSLHASEWAAFAEETAQLLAIPFKKFQITLTHNTNIEELAREARYNVFESLLTEDDVLVLAHHQHDQAETVLMHLFRGAGIDGLSGMPGWRKLGKGKLCRPLLSLTRKELERYARENQLSWVEDESNQNTRFNRNFLRHQIIPELQMRWPGVIQNLCRSAQHCASAKQFIQREIDKLLPMMINEKGCLSLQKLLDYPHETQYLLLRQWLTQQHFKKPSHDKIARILDEVVMAKQDACPLVSWKGCEIRRYQGWLYAIALKHEKVVERKFPFCEGARRGDFLRNQHENINKILAELKEKHPNSLIEIRFRQGGEKIRFQGKTRELKKIFQEWHMPPWERDRIPLFYKDGELIKIGSAK